MTNQHISSRTNYLQLWGVFFLYLLLAAWGTAEHELWGDEIHAWNIAKSSVTITDLFRYTRYEGHPPLWHLFLFVISRFTHDPVYMQVLHFLFAAVVVWLIIFESPLPKLSKILLPFGYFFLYEYAVLSRNYSLAVMLVMLILLVIRKNTLLYFIFLFLLSFTHIYGILIALSLHCYYLIFKKENKGNWLLPGVAGCLLLLPAIWFVFPPSEGETNLGFFLDRWEFSQVMISIQAPLRAWVPIPAWWELNSWNTEFILQWQQHFRWLKFITPLLSAGIIVLALRVLIDDRKAWLLFAGNLLMNLVFSSVIFPMAATRYAGFIFVGWIAAWWLFCAVKQPDKTSKTIVHFFLIIQIIAASIALVKDIRRPFTRFPEIQTLIDTAPVNIPVVTDYWTLNAVSAFTDSPMYCIDLRKSPSFIVWGADFALIRQQQNRYDAGMNAYFNQSLSKEVCLITTGSPLQLVKVDSVFINHYHPELIKALEGSIEKGGDLYLYKIRRP